jgi:hypothetical protein
MPENTPEERRSKWVIRRRAHTVWISIEFLSVQLAEAIERDIAVMRREIDLFLGTILLLLGLLNWSTSKYCDGNTADYLSCTRPDAYYYYSGFSIALIVLGVLLILIWTVKKRSYNSK